MAQAAGEDEGGPPGRDALDAALLAAHARGDKTALVSLYTQAADGTEADGDIDAAAFYLTHGYVYALDLGDARAAGLHGRLKVWGREE